MRLWFCKSHDACISLLVANLSDSVLLSQVLQSFVLSSLASLEIAKRKFAHCHVTLSLHVKIFNVDYRNLYMSRYQVLCGPSCLGRQGSGWYPRLMWGSIMVYASIPDRTTSVCFCIFNCRHMGQQLYSLWQILALESRGLSRLLWGHLSSHQQGRFPRLLTCFGPLWWASWHGAHRPSFEILPLLPFA